MPARTISAPDRAWRRVAERITARRDELDMDQQAVVAATDGEISLSWLSLVENARNPSYVARKVRALSIALWGSRDAIERLLEGNEPTSDGAVVRAITNLTPATMRDVIDAEDRLRHRIGDLERRLTELEAAAVSADGDVVALAADRGSRSAGPTVRTAATKGRSKPRPGATPIEQD